MRGANVARVDVLDVGRVGESYWGWQAGRPKVATPESRHINFDIRGWKDVYTVVVCCWEALTAQRVDLGQSSASGF
jgi:hypothetical protein